MVNYAKGFSELRRGARRTLTAHFSPQGGGFVILFRITAKACPMSIALDLPPVIEQDVRYCANARGISLAQFVFELVEREAARIRKERANRVQPNVSDFIGYGLKFCDKPATTVEYMAEMRE